jgi:phospholipase/carboxylesterase
MQHLREHTLGRLTADSGLPSGPRLQPGLHSLPGQHGAQHLLFVPAETLAADVANRSASARSRVVPLVVMFHGSGSDPLRMLGLVEREAAAAGVAVLLPKSAGYTWDAILGAFGADVAELDRLIETVSALMPIDLYRLAAGGFSDGASYALSVGRVNGDRFRHVLAFSPGFVVPGPPAGTPRIFISHGTSDAVLPIERCSRLLVPALRREGYAVEYREFEGGHVVPPDLVKEALGVLSAAPAGDVPR